MNTCPHCQQLESIKLITGKVEPVVHFHVKNLPNSFQVKVDNICLELDLFQEVCNLFRIVYDDATKKGKVVEFVDLSSHFAIKNCPPGKFAETQIKRFRAARELWRINR